MLISRRKHKNLPRVDYLLIVGLLLAPMTGFRIWKIGPGEIICLLYALIGIVMYGIEYKKIQIPVNFWVSWILLMSIGTLIGIVLYPNQVDPLQLTTYIYQFVVVLGLLSHLTNRSKIQLEKLFKHIFIAGSIFFSLLLFYGTFFENSFLGSPLWYGRVRFTAGGTNPHQFALLGGILFYFGILTSKNESLKIKRIFCIGLSCLIFYISLQTQSSTLVASYVLSLFMLFILVIISVKNVLTKALTFMTAVVVCGLITIIFYRDIFVFIWRWIESDPNGPGRFRLWSKIFPELHKSPIFGLGPGSHSPLDEGIGRFVEYHNSYLEVLAMSGLTGLFALIRFIWKSLQRFKENWIICIMFVFQLGYGVAGFALRRIPFWVSFALSWSYILSIHTFNSTINGKVEP